jgi:hypothetical protein
MLYICTRSKPYASAYIHQAAWTEYPSKFVYLRFTGKPAFVRAISGSLVRGNSISVFMEDKSIDYSYGPDRPRCFFQKAETFSGGKKITIGIATLFSQDLFNPHSSISYVIGKDKQFIQKTVQDLLKKQTILYLDSWDINHILKELDLIQELKGYNMKAYEITWEIDSINTKISELVKRKQLRF